MKIDASLRPLLWAICAFAAGCGGGSSEPADTTPPTVTIVFPAVSSMVDGDEIYIRGTARDDRSAIAGIRIGGVDADSSDGFATWSATVPIDSGSNALLVEARDTAGNFDTRASEIRVISEPIAARPTTIAPDVTGGRLMVLDRSLAGIVTVDWTSGEREYFSDRLRPPGQPPFARPEAIVIDPSGNRALVVDGGRRALVSVDLATGTRMILSDAEVPQTDNVIRPFNSAMALDSDRSRVLILGRPSPNPFPGLNPFPVSPPGDRIELTPRSASIMSVDLATGARTVLSDGTTPNGNNMLLAAVGLVIDEATDRAFVADSHLDAIVAVDLATGARTLFSDIAVPGVGSAPVHPSGLAIDVDGNRLLVAVTDPARDGDTILAVDLSTGQRTVVSTDDAAPESGALFASADVQNRLAFERAAQRAFLVELGDSAIEAIDVQTGDRTPFVDLTHVPDATAPLRFPGSVAMDEDRGRALVLDAGSNTVVGIDLSTGRRRTVASFETGSALLDASAGIAVDADAGVAFVAQFDLSGDTVVNQVVQVDLTSGSTTVVSDLPSSGSDGAAVILGSRIALDAANRRVLALQSESIVAVDLDSSARSIFSDFDPALGFPDAGSALRFSAIAVDEANARALLLRTGLDLLAVDLNTGMASLLSEAPVPPVLSADASGSLAIDRDGDRVLLITADGITAIDLDSGDRATVSDFRTAALDTPILGPQGIAVDSANRRGLVVDDVVGGLYLVDLPTGRRAVISR